MFDCHELLEAVWNDAVDDERRFVQGIIQIAVAILHWESKHKPGALSVFRTGRELLAPFRGTYRGVEIEPWLVAIDQLFAPVLSAPGDTLPALDYRSIPKLKVDGLEP
jgi:predicted metal-dependent hydrolase